MCIRDRNTAEAEKSETTAGSSSDGKIGFFFGPKVNFSASVSHKSEQTRTTDTRAKYSFNVCARRQGPPESFMRLIDAVTATVANPSQTKPALSDNLLQDPDVYKRQSGRRTRWTCGWTGRGATPISTVWLRFSGGTPARGASPSAPGEENSRPRVSLGMKMC